MKTLLELIETLNEADEEDVIFAREKWSPLSEADLFRLTKDESMPEEPKNLGLKYFLEVHVARELLEGIAGDRSVTTLKKCERLIEYALNDA